MDGFPRTERQIKEFLNIFKLSGVLNITLREDVSSADLSAVLISAMPLEGRRLQVDARTENGRVIGLRVLPG